MNELVYVGIAEYRMLKPPGILACSALGSCVGVCVWDCETKLSGLLHVLLPAQGSSSNTVNQAKFADSGVALMVNDMERRGAKRGRLRAKLVGGACLYQYERPCAASEIGERNVEAARAALAELRIPILAEHVGGDFGRSIRFDSETFAIRVNLLSQGVSFI